MFKENYSIIGIMSGTSLDGVDLAHIICTSRQTATQLLNEMESNGTIIYSRKEIIITDISKL